VPPPLRAPRRPMYLERGKREPGKPCARAKGEPGNLELDINFMLRTPLWPFVTKECHPVGSICAARVSALDLLELTAGKLAALLARSASRKVFLAELGHHVLAAATPGAAGREAESHPGGGSICW